MAETSGPWDGSGFAQDEWRELFSSSAMDGVLLEDGSSVVGLTPTFSPSNREVTFSPGKARIRGNLYISDANIVVNVPAPSGSNQRIDYVVLRYDPSEGVLDDRITMQLVQGQEASDPSPPSLTQDFDGVWEWPRIRIGPFGTGAISGAPWDIMGTTIQPVTFRVTNPNNGLPGMSTVPDALSIDIDGKIWRYVVDQGQYARLGDPQTGTISLASGWSVGSSSGNTPRWWVKDGLVHLAGSVNRSGGDFQLPTGTPGAKFTNTLPSAIRPGREMTLDGEGIIADSATGSGHRQSSILFYYDSDNRLGVMDGIHSSAGDQFMRTGGDLFLHSVSWVIV